MANSSGAQHHFVVTGSDQALYASFDQHLMERVLTNLIDNAVKYSPPKTTIRFEIQRQADQIMMAISDEGIGIPRADQQRLFEIFERGSNVGPIKGTGLGLAIVKQAVELHKGQVAVESSAAGGTTIRISLPG
jgi:signal transduction histidine kinase